MDDSTREIERVRMAQGLNREKVSDVEVQLLIDTAKRLGLDPIMRQVWYQARADKSGTKKAQVLATIDGLRVVAERSGEYEGQTAPQWCGEDGVWREVWTAKIAMLVAARVGVYRKGFREPMYAVARVAAYSSGQGQWEKNGDNMTSKCAEALALRKAFPQLLSGIYTGDEMEHDRPEAVIDAAPTRSRAELLADTLAELETAADLKRLIAKRRRDLAAEPQSEAGPLLAACMTRLGIPADAQAATMDLIWSGIVADGAP